jgi:hypothetical protein
MGPRTDPLRRLSTILVAIAIAAPSAKSQEPARVNIPPFSRVERIRFVPTPPAARSSLALEALGGSLGSAAGIGLVVLISDCGVDDLACDILTAGAAGVAGVVGATVGTALVARQTGARYSVAGAALGAILGTAVGLGVHYLVNSNSDRNLDDAIVLPIFAISQGLFAAIAGRW